MVKEYGITGTSHPSDLLLSSDTNFYILGAIGNSTVLMKTDLNGDTLWVNYYQGLGTGLKLIEKNNHLYIVGGTSSFGNGLSDIILMKVASDGSSSNCNETTSSTFFTNPSSVIITTWAEGNSAFTTSTSVTATTNILSLEECQACIIADFDFSVINNVVTFNNLSDPAVSYYWDFDDLNTSSDLNPSNTYSTCGTFDVCLVAYDSCSSDTICQTIDMKPTVLTNNLTVYLDASGAASISIADIDSSSSDNCSSSLSLD
ncbi:MAG: PKD domain-containing protein, partial [Methylophagaceae bacterium]